MDTRARVEKKLAVKQREEKEERLREMALNARTNRAGIRAVGNAFICTRERNGQLLLSSSEKTDDEEAERDQIRQERQKERQRAAALQKAGGEKR